MHKLNLVMAGIITSHYFDSTTLY